MGQVSKLNFVDEKLGANLGGQQTTRIVYDTTLFGGPLNSDYLEFFKTFQNKTLGQTNLTTNKLDSSESMVIKTISFYSFNGGGSPYPRLDNSIFLNGSLITITVGNQEVVKRLPLQYNVTGQAFDRLHSNGGTQQQALVDPNRPIQFETPCEIRLLTDIVLPPQVSFSVRVENAAGFGRPTSAMVCVLSGYGKIFSAGSSF